MQHVALLAMLGIAADGCSYGRPKSPAKNCGLTVDILQEGTYEFQPACMLVADRGVFRTSINGKNLPLNGDAPVSLAAPYRVLSGMFGGLPVELPAGKHDLVFTADESGKKIGLDFLGIRKRGIRARNHAPHQCTNRWKPDGQGRTKP